MIRRALATLALVAAPLAAAGEDVTSFALDNGMEVVVIEDHRAPAVVHMVWYKVGAADEPPGKSGIAHLLEHLMFKGTETRDPGAFSDFVRANGGRDNAFTSWDYTGYFQRVAADLLPQMMEFEADRMTNLVLDAEVTAPEIDVVLEERAQRVDNNPQSLGREQMRAAQFLNHPYGIPIIGWRHEIEALSHEDALAFYDTHYAPDNAILIVAGDVTPDEVRALAQEHYGPIPPAPDHPERTRPQEPPQTAARRVVFEDPRIAQPYVSRSYLAPERDPSDQDRAAALVLLADLLGGDPASSYLGQRLQFGADSVALYVGAFYGPTWRDDTTFNLTIAPKPGTTLADAEAALDAALAEYLEGGVDADHLARLKRQYAADAVYLQDDAQRRARRIGTALTAGLTLDDVDAWPDVIQSVTETDIIAAARAVLTPETSVTALMRAPETATPEVTQ